MKKTICIAGKNNIAVNVVSYIKDNYPECNILGICNENDYGVDTWQKSFKKYCKENHISIVTLDEAESIENLYFISTEYDKIIKPSMFHTNSLFNIHFSLLPKYKGMHICLMHILNGETEGGVTFHKMDSGIDTGDIIFQRKIDIDAHDSARDLYLKLINTGSKTVIEQLPIILKGDYVSKPQEANYSSYYSKSSFVYSKYNIDLNQTAWNISRQIKALCFREYQIPQVMGSDVFDYKILSQKSKQKPGTLLWENEYSLAISTIDYDILLYKDKYFVIDSAIEREDSQTLRQIPNIFAYRNESNGEGISLLEKAKKLNFKDAVSLLSEKGSRR